MVNYDSGLDFTFAALADPTRRAILASLALGTSSVSQLAEPHRMSLPAVMKHLSVLERAGLIRQEKEGRVRHCRLVFDPLKQADDWISRYRSFWEAQFDSLDRYLTQEQNKESLSCLHPKSQLEPLKSVERLPRRGRKSSGPGRTPKS